MTPSSIVRIILGLPFILFFPGYTFVAALFPRKDEMDGIERVTLSLGISIAVVALIGFGLNYTAWGIRLEPVLYSVAAFIILTSAIALIRGIGIPKQPKLTMDFTLKISGWGDSIFSKVLSVTLIVFIIGALAVLGYTVATPKIGEKYTEFYILGLNNTAQNYPNGFIMEGGRVTQVGYSAEQTNIAGEWAKVTVGLANHEQQKTNYSIGITIDGEPVNITYDGANISRLGPISLEHGQKWEHQIGFAPEHAGDNQKVEIILFKDGSAYPDNSLNLWIDVRDSSPGQSN